jgi:hypothetical protein
LIQNTEGNEWERGLVLQQLMADGRLGFWW